MGIIPLITTPEPPCFLHPCAPFGALRRSWDAYSCLETAALRTPARIYSRALAPRRPPSTPALSASLAGARDVYGIFIPKKAPLIGLDLSREVAFERSRPPSLVWAKVEYLATRLRLLGVKRNGRGLRRTKRRPPIGLPL